jgi:hypothetical protein
MRNRWVVRTWDHYRQFAAVELHDAAALSVDVDPDQLLTLTMEASGAITRLLYADAAGEGHFDIDLLVTEFAARCVTDYEAEFGTNNPPLPRDPLGMKAEIDRRVAVAQSHILAGALRRVSVTGDVVMLSEFARWAVELGWVVPRAFASLADVAEPPKGSRRESREQRQDRRLERYEAMGAKRVKQRDGSWRYEGQRGALARLAREEKAAGHPYNDERNVAADLDEAAQRRLDAAALRASVRIRD